MSQSRRTTFKANSHAQLLPGMNDSNSIQAYVQSNQFKGKSQYNSGTQVFKTTQQVDRQNSNRVQNKMNTLLRKPVSGKPVNQKYLRPQYYLKQKSEMMQVYEFQAKVKNLAQKIDSRTNDQNPDEVFFQRKYESLNKFSEKKELEVTLRDLRSKHDTLILKCQQRKKELAFMKDRIRLMNLKLDSQKQDLDHCYKTEEEVQKEYDQLSLALDTVLDQKMSYQHMHDTLKKDHLSHQIAFNNLNRMQNKQEHNLNQKSKKAKKFEIDEYYTKEAMDKIRSHRRFEEKQKEDNIKTMHQTISKKNEMELKRDERNKRQAEVAETAAAESKNLNERKWRQLALVHKFLNFFLLKKKERELERFKIIEEAIVSLKEQTGMLDPEEYVKKFETRQQGYSDLLYQADTSEKKLNQKREQLETLIKEKEKAIEKYHNFDLQKNSKIQEANQEIYKEMMFKMSNYENLAKEQSAIMEWLKTIFRRLDEGSMAPKKIKELMNQAQEEKDSVKGVRLVIKIIKDFSETVDKEVFKKMLSQNEQKKSQEFIEVMMAQHNRKYWKEKRDRSPGSVGSGGGNSSSGAGSDF